MAAKNILIFADGTGNASGILFDERRSNVYKLYRATRSGPDSPIDPNRQIAIYIPGVGTVDAPGAPWWKRLWKEVIEGSVGGGLTSQIIDCYAALINSWRPGDRIYLFGFSRGAYAVRCLAHVLEMIGIPQTEADGSPLNFESRSLRRVAAAAVKTLYRFGLPKPGWATVERYAGYFRTNHRTLMDPSDTSLPYCMGVWDSVGAIGWLHFASFRLFQTKAFQSLSLVSQHYDMHYPPNIPFARHALAIDEYRRDFARVLWGGSGTVKGGDIKGVTRFGQVWFAGNHSDIGGSYLENESRLSDITLDWMAKFISKELPDCERQIKINPQFLVLNPSCEGMMHDEMMVGKTPANIHMWGPATERQVVPEGELHVTVLDRFARPIVRNFIGFGPYRPHSLKDHPKVKHLY